MTHERGGWGVAPRSSQEARHFKGNAANGERCQYTGLSPGEALLLRATPGGNRSSGKERQGKARQGKAPSKAWERGRRRRRRGRRARGKQLRSTQEVPARHSRQKGACLGGQGRQGRLARLGRPGGLARLGILGRPGRRTLLGRRGANAWRSSHKKRQRRRGIADGASPTPVL